MNIALKRAAIAQLCSSSNKFQNLQSIAKCAAIAKTGGASMLFCPENCGFMGSSGQESIKNGERITSNKIEPLTSHEKYEWLTSLEQIVDGQDSQEVQQDEDNKNVSLICGLQTIAKQAGLWISGCIHESGAPDGRVYNTHIVMDNNGEIVAKYRKIHLFDLHIPDENINLCESNTTAPGNKYVVCDSPIGRLGLSTCYDLRFGEMYRELVDVGGANVLLVPSAFTVPTGKAHWHALLKARAIENQCWVIAAAQYGKHNEKRDSYGHSIVFDPWGKVVCDAGGYDSNSSLQQQLEVPSVVIFDIDDNMLNNVRKRIPIQDHRKNANATW